MARKNPRLAVPFLALALVAPPAVSGCGGCSENGRDTDADVVHLDADLPDQPDATDEVFDPVRDDDPQADDADAEGEEADDAAEDPGEEEEAPPSERLIEVDATRGWQIHPPGEYRYGPAIIVNDDGSIDMWTCSPGSGGPWDFIRHRHSTDGGLTWTPDQVALEPTPGTRDACCACDPGLFMTGSVYTIGYTSTDVVDGPSAGCCNNIFAARSASPTGPWEKWNGTGWGGAPLPVVEYGGPIGPYGFGEPSFVVNGALLYMYYTNSDETGCYTDLATADAALDDWPAHLTSHGHVIVRRSCSEDSADLKFLDALDRFVAVDTYDRFGVNATIGVYQSHDGILFEPAPFRGARVQQGAHNAGIAGSGTGHIDGSFPVFIAYAYQPPSVAWGQWPMFLDPVAFSLAVPGTPVGGAVSSVTGDLWEWSGPNAWDGDPSTVFSSAGHATCDAVEALNVDLGRDMEVTGLTVTPRPGGTCFPRDFKIETRTAAGAWADVPGQLYADFPNPGDSPVSLDFADPVAARHVQLTATLLAPDEHGNCYLQIAEMMPGVR